MTGKLFRSMGALGTMSAALLPLGVLAQETGQPQAGEIGWQASVTPLMDSIHAFHDGPLLWVAVGIALLVLLLLLLVIFRFNAKANPTPSKTTHNTLIEIVWTVVPILILVIIAIPSSGVDRPADHARPAQVPGLEHLFVRRR